MQDDINENLFFDWHLFLEVFKIEIIEWKKKNTKIE